MDQDDPAVLRMLLDEARLERDALQRRARDLRDLRDERAAARARVAELEVENRQLRMRLDEMDIRAGEVLDSPVVDGRTSVRPEYVEALRATMSRPIDQEEMPR